MEDPMAEDPPVGYRHPPRRTQFRRGESGNPSGRPKVVKNFASDLVEALSEPITIKVGGREITVSKQRAAALAAVSAACDGHLGAIALLLNFCLKIQGPNEAEKPAD